MKKRLICVFLTSLTLFEILSFFFVYHSNQALFETVNVLKSAGHTVVPNDHVLSSLKEFAPAFYSSLFILSTAGILVSLILCFFAYIFLKSKFKKPRNVFTYCSIFLAALMMSGLFLVTLADQSIFLRTRDYLLLSNPVGTAINNFYYKYTPYAAQAINPPFRKQIKSCWIDPELPGEKNLDVLLEGFGWFATPNKKIVSFIIKESVDDNLIFLHKKKIILSVSLKQFRQNPEKYLKQYSGKTDYAFGIRFLCAAGIFTGLPIFCFIVLFLSIFLICRKWIAIKPALIVSGILVSGFTLISLIYIAPVKPLGDMKAIQGMLESKNSKTRIEALRILSGKNEDIRQFPDYFKTHVNTPSIPEKYWQAAVLAKSKSVKSVQYLKRLVKDDSLNVRCASIKALSKFNCTNDTATIFKDLIVTSPEWYVQQFAYTASKGCQWKKGE